MSTDAVEAIPTPPAVVIIAPTVKPELVGVGLLIAALVVGFATASHYGFTVDEFNPHRTRAPILSQTNLGDGFHIRNIPPLMFCNHF